MPPGIRASNPTRFSTATIFSQAPLRSGRGSLSDSRRSAMPAQAATWMALNWPESMLSFTSA